MNVIHTAISDLLILEPRVFSDSRGFFLESWNARGFFDATGVDTHFVQDNHSRSVRNVLRGLHYQIRKPQGKLVRVIRGAVFDVAVDIRKTSSTFGRWVGCELSENNHRQFWIPPEFAHGFLVLSDSADFLYKTTKYYEPEFERCILWNDATLDIRWPVHGEPLLSPKDRAGLSFEQAEVFE
jgi:dTDP-4-dehydrorhamnose 3,5-epimerase